MAYKTQLFLRKFTERWFSFHKKIRITGQKYIADLQKPCIVVANHTRVADPFVLACALPKRWYPVHFLGILHFATPGLFVLTALGIIPLFYKLAGVIMVRAGKGIDANIAPALHILKRGGVVALFPEGKRNFTTEKLLPLRKGAAALAIKSDAPIVPAWITYTKEIEITFGPSFKLETNDYAKETAVIQKRLLELV